MKMLVTCICFFSSNVFRRPLSYGSSKLKINCVVKSERLNLMLQNTSYKIGYIILPLDV